MAEVTVALIQVSKAEAFKAMPPQPQILKISYCKFMPLRKFLIILLTKICVSDILFLVS